MHTTPLASTPSTSSTTTPSSTKQPAVSDNNTPLYIKRGLTKKNMEALYSLAHCLYQEQKYEEACPFFQLMAYLNNQDRRAWLGAAACLEALKKYQDAIGCYGCAAILDGNDPMPFLRSFNCFLEKNDTHKAIESLDVAIQIASAQEGRYAELKEQATKIKQALLK